jgi:hypothetical protein
VHRRFLLVAQDCGLPMEHPVEPQLHRMRSAVEALLMSMSAKPSWMASSVLCKLSSNSVIRALHPSRAALCNPGGPHPVLTGQAA